MHYSSYARLLLLGAIWGFSFLFMRMVAPVLGAVPTAFFRVLFASLGLIVILMVLRTRWQFQGKFRQTLLLGAINSGIPFLMYTFAARLLPAGYSAIFNATAPLMGVLIGALFFQEAISPRKLVGVITAVKPGEVTVEGEGEDAREVVGDRLFKVKVSRTGDDFDAEFVTVPESKVELPATEAAEGAEAAE